MERREVVAIAITFSLVALAFVGVTTAIVQPVAAYSGSIYAGKASYYGYESVQLICGYSAYYKSDAYGIPTGMCLVDGQSFYSGYGPNGGTTKTYGPFSFGPGTHTLTMYYATGWDRADFDYYYASTTGQFTMSCIVMNPVTLSHAWDHVAYNKDVNQDCKVDSVVVQYSQSWLDWPYKLPDGSTAWADFNDGYTNSFSFEFTRMATDGTVSWQAWLGAYALELQPASSSWYSSKQLIATVLLAHPKTTSIVDPINHLSHAVSSAYFIDVGLAVVGAVPPGTAQRAANLASAIDNVATSPMSYFSWNPSTYNPWYTVNTGVDGTGVDFHGLLRVTPELWYVTADSHDVRCLTTWLNIYMH